MKPTSPLDRIRTMVWVRTAMALTGSSTPGELGKALEKVGKQRNIRRACNKYDNGDESVAKHLTLYSFFVSELTGRIEDKADLEALFYNGPDNIWKFYQLPSSLDLETSGDCYDDRIKELESNKQLPLDKDYYLRIFNNDGVFIGAAIMEWMIRLELFVNSVNTTYIFKNESILSGRYKPYEIIPNETHEDVLYYHGLMDNLYESTFPRLVRATYFLYGYIEENLMDLPISYDELFLSVWNHGLYQVRKTYPKKVCEEAKEVLIDEFIEYTQDGTLGLYSLREMELESWKVIDTSPTSPLRANLEEVMKLYTDGVSPAAIGREYDVSRQGASKFISKLIDDGVLNKRSKR